MTKSVYGSDDVESTEIGPGQQWRSIVDGHTISIIQESIKSARWFVRFDGSELITIIAEDQLLDGYEFAAFPPHLRFAV